MEQNKEEVAGRYTFRLSRQEDVPRIMEIFEEAKSIMRENGNLTQWVDGYPSEGVLLEDIALGNSYVVIDPTSKSIVGTFACIAGEEPTYRTIYEGQCLDDSLPYVTIHRLASTAASHGVAYTVFDFVLSEFYHTASHISNHASPISIRIDTHRDNTIMRHLLLAYGFSYCGIIYLNSGAERLAYQCLLQQP